jgi:hypothetical protein
MPASRSAGNNAPQRSLMRQRLIPRSSRTTPPVTSARTRQSPQRLGGKIPLLPGIPAYPRSARTRQDRPVTPEVACSSPVGPVKVPVNSILCCLCGHVCSFLGQQNGLQVCMSLRAFLPKAGCENEQSRLLGLPSPADSHASAERSERTHLCQCAGRGSIAARGR